MNKNEIQKTINDMPVECYSSMKFQILNLENSDLFRILRFITLKKRPNIVGRNKRLNHLAIDNNKNLIFRTNNSNTLTRLVQKIRNFNQFNDYIQITLESDLQFLFIRDFMEQNSQKLNEKDLRQLKIDLRQ